MREPESSAFLGSRLARRDMPRRPGWLACSVLRHLGVRSYAFFLFQVPVIFVANAVLNTPTSMPRGLATMVLTFAACWLVAAIAYRLIEEPSRRALTQRRRAPRVPEQRRPIKTLNSVEDNPRMREVQVTERDPQS